MRAKRIFIPVLCLLLLCLLPAPCGCADDGIPRYTLYTADGLPIEPAGVAVGLQWADEELLLCWDYEGEPLYIELEGELHLLAPLRCGFGAALCAVADGTALPRTIELRESALEGFAYCKCDEGQLRFDAPEGIDFESLSPLIPLCPRGIISEETDDATCPPLVVMSECVLGVLHRDEGGYFVLRPMLLDQVETQTDVPEWTLSLPGEINTQQIAQIVSEEPQEETGEDGSFLQNLLESESALWIVGAAAALALALLLVLLLSGRKRKKTERKAEGRVKQLPAESANVLRPGEVELSFPTSDAAPHSRVPLVLFCRRGFFEGMRYPIRGTIRIGCGGTDEIRFPQGSAQIGAQQVVLRYQGETLLLSTGQSGTTLYRRTGSSAAPQPLPPETSLPIKPGDSIYLGDESNEFAVVEQRRDNG